MTISINTSVPSGVGKLERRSHSHANSVEAADNALEAVRLAIGSRGGSPFDTMEMIMTVVIVVEYAFSL